MFLWHLIAESLSMLSMLVGSYLDNSVIVHVFSLFAISWMYLSIIIQIPMLHFTIWCCFRSFKYDGISHESLFLHQLFWFAGAIVDLPIHSEVTQPSWDSFLISKCWQTLFRKAYVFPINIINLLNVSKGCWPDADAVWLE